ncbi:hypothetical protein HN51_006044 [Arachis hypogaea]
MEALLTSILSATPSTSASKTIASTRSPPLTSSPTKPPLPSSTTRLYKLQRVDDALQVIEYMARTDAGGCRPSATTFHPILNILTRQKTIDHAQRVVNFMSTLGINGLEKIVLKEVRGFSAEVIIHSHQSNPFSHALCVFFLI